MNVKKTAAVGMLAAGVAIGLAATPAFARTLKVSVDSFKDGGTYPTNMRSACRRRRDIRRGGPNISPSISWSKGPRGTQSYAIILYDTNSPAEHREMMNKEGVTMTAQVKRHDFYHWVLVDIPANVTSLKEGDRFQCARVTRQAGNAGAGRRARAQRLHQGDGQQRRHERTILRLRRPVPAVE